MSGKRLTQLEADFVGFQAGDVATGRVFPSWGPWAAIVAGTLVGVAHRAGLLDKDGRLPRLNRAPASR